MVGLDPLWSTLLESSQLPPKTRASLPRVSIDKQRLAIGSLFG